jgi:hypothetical protein
MESGPLYPEDFDLMSYLNDNPNEYQKVWEPWLTKAAVHAIATSEDGDFLAVGGGYLYDNEIHIYRWNLETREYDKVWDSSDGIIKGDVLSLAFGDTDNNKFMDIVAGSADGHIYVFEQRHIYDPYTRTENQFEHVWTSPKLRPVFSVLVEDTDKDGVLDILAGSWDGKVRAYEYSRHSGYPFSTEHWIDYEEVWSSGDIILDKVTAITTADTNYNGLPEIIAGTRNGSIYIFENDGAVLYVEGVPFPLTNDNSYVLNFTISGHVWKPILSLDSGDLDGDSDDEIVAVAAGQGAYVLDYMVSGYRLNKLTRPLESWELGAGPLAGYPLNYYVNDMVSAKSVFYGWRLEPMDQPPQEISPWKTAMAGEPDGRYSLFRPYLTFVADYGDDPWGTTPEFPDPTAKWIWNHPWTEVRPEKGARVEEFWVIREFDLASPVDLTISVTVDDYYTLYIDEMLVGNATKWETTETYKVELSAGPHSLRLKVGNAGTEDNPAGLIVSVKESASEEIVFNSRGDGTWRTRATAVLDFGKHEEPTGNGNEFHDLIVNFSTPSGFAAEPNFEELSFSVSQDNATFATIEAKDLQSETFDGGFYVYINLDGVLAKKRWEYVQYLNITAYGDMNYAVDSIEAETLYRPLSTATAATIGTLNLDSQHSVWEFADRLEAYNTGVEYEEVVETYGREKEPNKVVVGTADGRLLAFGYNSTSRSYDLIWDSYTEDWFNMKTNIWAIQEVKTLGKIPTWMLNKTMLDVPLSFKIDFPFAGYDYASMTFADVNLDQSLDLIVGTKQGSLTSPTFPTLETIFSDVNMEYTEKWVSAAFGQLNYTQVSLPIYVPLARTYAAYIMLELIVGYYSPATGYGGLDYWNYPYEEKIPLASMESTGYLRQALRMSSTLPKATIADMDKDGDYDITLTNGRIYYLENIGNTTDPTFEMKPDYYSSINLMSPDKVFSSPQLVDFDSDGDYDLIVGFANKHGATYYENTGTSQNPVWVEARRLFYNSKYSFRNDNFTDPAFYDAGGLYDILDTRGEALPAREVFLKAYVDTFGTSYVMSAYNNATNEIVAFVGDIGSHSRFVVGTNPRVARLEVALANGPLRNHGYHVLETWNNDADLDEWTITVASGDVDGDEKNEVIVGDFDNNIYVFEHLINNTYKRAFRSFDINHTVVLEESPYAWEQLEGLSGKFYRKIWDHVEQLIADTDLDNDDNKEIIATADLSIYVFEWTGIDDEYKLIWREDLRKSAWGRDLKAEGVEKITALSYHEDLDHNGYGEIIVGAGDSLFIYESRPDDTFVGGHQTSTDVVGYWNFDEASGVLTGDSSGYDNIGTLSTGPTWVDGKYGKALSFDGINDYVEVPDSDSLDITNEITIEAWINFNPLKVGQRYTIVGKHYTAYELTLSQYNPQTRGRTLQFFKGDPNYDPNDLEPSGGRSYDGFHLERLDDVLLPNMWNHIAVTWRGVTVRFYINGNIYSPTSIDWEPVAETTNTNAYPLRIGTRYALTLNFNGTIDEVKFYNRALTEAEMAAIMGRLSFQGRTIQTIATGDTDSDGYNEIIIGGYKHSLNGFIYVLEHRDGIYSQVWSAPYQLIEGSYVNTIVIDDQDYDGRKELIVGHEYGINIWEYIGGTDNEYDTKEVITSSLTYPKVKLFPSHSWNDTEIPSFRRNSDIIQLSNGTLIQIYSKETGETVDMGFYDDEDEVRLFFRTSHDDGTTWTPEKRFTNNAEYESLFTWDPNYTIVSETMPSITESADGKVWFAWATVVRRLEYTDWDIYIPLFHQYIFAKYFETSWSPLETIVRSTQFIYGAFRVRRTRYYSPSIWYYGQLEFEVGRRTLIYHSVAVSYINSTDGRVHCKRREILFYLLPIPPETNPTIVYDWRSMAALPYIGSDPSFPFIARTIDMITLHDGGRVLAFAGRYKNESKVDDDIWVMSLNSTMGWKFPNRVTVKSSQEKHPSITQLNSQDETIIVVFESYGGPPEEAIEISYSKDLGRSWSEPEPLSAIGEEPVSPSVAARKDEGFFYSFTTAQWMITKRYRFKHIIYEWTLRYGIFVGVNPSSNWTKYEIGNVQTLAIGDTDRDGLREIAANHQNKVTLFEIKHTGASCQEHIQVWTSEELTETVTHIAIGDGNGNGWPEIIIAAERGNVYSYEITNTDLPKGSFMASSMLAEITIYPQFIVEAEVDIATGNFDQDLEPELVATVYENVTAYEANGLLLWRYSAESTIKDMAIGDLNNDGVDDVVVGDWDGIVYTINGSDGTQLWSFPILHEGFVPFIDRVAIGDLNGDGSNDVIVGTSTGDVKFHIYFSWGYGGSTMSSLTSMSALIIGLNVGNLTRDVMSTIYASGIRPRPRRHRRRRRIRKLYIRP